MLVLLKTTISLTWRSWHSTTHQRQQSHQRNIFPGSTAQVQGANEQVFRASIKNCLSVSQSLTHSLRQADRQAVSHGLPQGRRLSLWCERSIGLCSRLKRGPSSLAKAGPLGLDFPWGSTTSRGTPTRTAAKSTWWILLVSAVTPRTVFEQRFPCCWVSTTRFVDKRIELTCKFTLPHYRIIGISMMQFWLDSSVLEN